LSQKKKRKKKGKEKKKRKIEKARKENQDVVRLDICVQYVGPGEKIKSEEQMDSIEANGLNRNSDILTVLFDNLSEIQTDK